MHGAVRGDRWLAVGLVLVTHFAAIVHAVHGGVLQLLCGSVGRGESVLGLVVDEVHEAIALGAVVRLCTVVGNEKEKLGQIEFSDSILHSLTSSIVIVRIVASRISPYTLKWSRISASETMMPVWDANFTKIVAAV